MWRYVLFLLCTLALNLTFLAGLHYATDSPWVLQYLHVAVGSDGILWQVQTTFFAVGFAGLAIAAQLFAEAPLAIGASRGRVLEYVGASWFVGIGLVANVVIAVETIWLPSTLGVLFIGLAWFVPTVVLLVVSTVRLTRLFGHPSMLDQVVRTSLVETVSNRLNEASRRYADAKKNLHDVVVTDLTLGIPKGPAATLRVPVPEVGRVIRAVRVTNVREAIASLSIRATEDASTTSEPAQEYLAPQIALAVELGDRTRLGETAFRVITSKPLDETTNRRIVRLLQSSIEFEPPGSVTPYEEADRDIANLKDAIGTNLRSGAFATAERALDLLGQVVLGVWMAESGELDTSRRASFTRRDWLFRSIGDVEQDALLSPRAAGIFVGAAMTRALEAPRTGLSEYVDECLRSFTRLWFTVLAYGGPEFETIPLRITTCVQNLAAYSFSAADDPEALQARGVWAMVELVKLALDAKKPESAKVAAEELNGLFEFDRESLGRSHVLAGQLVLSGWLDYLAATGDERAPTDPSLRALVTARGTWSEIVAGRNLAEQRADRFSRWEWWEMKWTASIGAQTLQLSKYIDRAQVAALASSHGLLPPARDQETASEYSRFLSLLNEPNRVLSGEEEHLKQNLVKEVAAWDAAEDGRLAEAPLSPLRIDALRVAIVDATNQLQRLAAYIPVDDDVSAIADVSRPILGMNFRIPRHFLVDQIFNQTLADPSDIGQMIARGFAEAEDRKIVHELRQFEGESRQPSASAIRKVIEDLGSEAEHYVLLTPYGGLEDLSEWYSIEFRETLKSVTRIETAVLDSEAILFDRRSTLRSCRKPEAKEGLLPVEGTSIALGVFEDVQDSDEPQVRVETGEYFVLWAGRAPHVTHFRGERNIADGVEGKTAG